jgi:lipopolysaccharide biosynthesis regulator YciM
MPTESTFLLAALFMIAAASGWAYARYSDRQREREAPPPLSDGYIRGLDLLLNQQTDQALDMFVRMIAADDEALDTHFALGTLFRRRGEVDRAIRIHQNILARPNLTDAQRDQARFALGEDYQRAGLLDRAEQLFSELADTADDPERPVRALIGIYEQLRDWDKAIEAREALQSLTREPQGDFISHYHCEIAEARLQAGDTEGAREHLKAAQKGRRRPARGAIIRARVAERQGDHDLAFRLYRRVLERDSSLLPEVYARLCDVATDSDRTGELDAFLRERLQNDPAAAKRLAYAAIVSDRLEPSAAAEAVERFILGNDTLASLIDQEALGPAAGERRRTAVRRMAGGLRRLATSVPRYRCSVCGWSTQRLAWQCPSCRNWDTNRPITDVPAVALLARGEDADGQRASG